MKKAIQAVLFAFAVLLSGCHGNTASSNMEDHVSDQPTEQVVETDTTQDSSEYFFPEVENDIDIILAYYRQEVSRRQEEGDENFVTEAEEEWLNKNGYEITNSTDGVIYKYSPSFHEGSYYYFPIVIFSAKENRLVYTIETGSIHITPSYSGNVVGGLNLSYNELEQMGFPTIVEEYVTETIVHTGTEFQVYRFGNLVETLPVDGVFCGHSFWEGYLFRDGTDVYSVEWDRNEGHYFKEVIAHDVKYVVEANYRLSSDNWSQPLFLMTDGSLKAYTSLGNGDTPDSLQNLMEPPFEGGYH